MKSRKNITRYKIHREQIKQKGISVEVLLLLIPEAFIPVEMPVLLSSKPCYDYFS
jgi:hypothetical protein